MQANKVLRQTHFFETRLCSRQPFQLKSSQPPTGPKQLRLSCWLQPTSWPSSGPFLTIDLHGSLPACFIVPTASVSGAATFQISICNGGLARKPSCTRPHASIDQGQPTAGSGAGGDDDAGGGSRGRRVQPPSGDSGGSDHGSDGDGNGQPDRHGRPGLCLAMFLLSPASILILVLFHLTPPALAAALPAASGPSASIPEADAALDTAAPATHGSGRGPQPRMASEDLAAAAANAPHQRMKRLLREVFAELTEHRARLEAMEAAAEDAADAEAAGESLVLPMEGFAVRPYSRALASELRLRCRAQVSGTVDAPALIPLAATVTETTLSPGIESPAAAPSLDRAGDFRALDWAGMAAAAGLSASLSIRVRIQSLWGNEGDGLSEKRSAAAASGAASAVNVLSAWQQRHYPQQQQGPPSGNSGLQRQDQQQPQQQRRPQPDQPGSKASAHLQLGVGAASGQGEQVSVEKLLMKAEVSPGLRGLLAARGSLDNIGKNANPFATASGGASRGLTAAMRRGHDLVLLAQQGAGVAVAAAAGSLSSALGIFTHGSLLSTIPTAAFTTCGQLSLHRSRRLALTAACSTTSPYNAARHDPADVPAPVPYRGTSIQDCDGAVGAGGGGEGRLLQRGFIGTVQLGSRLSAAVWVGDAITRTEGPICTSATDRHSAAGSGDGDEGGSGPLGPWQDAAPTHEAPCLNKCWRQRRVGLRLSTLPDEDTGRSYALCLSHRARAAEGPPGAGGGGGSELLIVEASASLPIAHGLVVTPGLVLVRSGGTVFGEHGAGGRTLVGAMASTSWSF